MADIVITLKIMPESPKTNLLNDKNIKKKIEKFGGQIHKVEEEPVAYGLKALKIIFIMDENKGSTDRLEEAISNLRGVNSVEVIDVRRAFG